MFHRWSFMQKVLLFCRDSMNGQRTMSPLQKLAPSIWIWVAHRCLLLSPDLVLPLISLLSMWEKTDIALPSIFFH